MPSARQGDIQNHDFSPVIGAEFSGCWPARIISNESNERFGTVIALPMSSAMTAEIYRTRQHAQMAGSGSWASTRQAKAMHQRRLGAVIGRASID